MFVIQASFDAETAYAQIRELLALGDSPERLTEKLGNFRDLDLVRQGVTTVSFKRLVTEVKKRRQFLELGQQIEAVKNGKSLLGFLSSKEKKLAKLEEEQRKFNAPLEGPKWFYTHPRVRLFSVIRDYALDGSLQNDASWTDIEMSQLAFPIASMFESGAVDFAQTLASELEKPLKQADPKYLLEHFEGDRSISFDPGTGKAIYYMAAPSAEAGTSS